MPTIEPFAEDRVVVRREATDDFVGTAFAARFLDR